jgi:hypothetical protein
MPFHGRVVRVEILWAITIDMLHGQTYLLDIWLLLLPIATPVVDSRLQFTLILCLKMSGIRERHLMTEPLTPTAITPTCFVRHHETNRISADGNPTLSTSTTCDPCLSDAKNPYRKENR